MAEFKDYPAEKIAEQAERVRKFKAEFPQLAELTRITAWEKWCNSYEYRKREWEFRQSVAKAVRPDVDYRPNTTQVR
jgi:hypothetical protein